MAVIAINVYIVLVVFGLEYPVLVPWPCSRYSISGIVCIFFKFWDHFPLGVQQPSSLRGEKTDVVSKVD